MNTIYLKTRPEDKICRFCKKKVYTGFLSWLIGLQDDYGYNRHHIMTKDGIEFIRKINLFHEKCAIKDFERNNDKNNKK